LKLLDGKKEKGKGLWPRRRRAINARRARLGSFDETRVAYLGGSLG
jgi:hypothetical protein